MRLVRVFKVIAGMLLLELLLSCGSSTPPAAPIASLISVSIKPSSAAVVTGMSQPFIASVTGTTNTAVNWLVNGIPGGNSTVGTISSAGLYTAPSSVPSNPAVTVTARSVSDPSSDGNASVTITAAPRKDSVLWSADMETGTLLQWYAPATTYGCIQGVCNGGGEFDSGSPGVNGEFSVASQDVAHGGSWSDKLSITASSTTGHSSGTRMFRWNESDNTSYFSSGLYYSVWAYIPQVYTMTGNPANGRFWNFIQFKSKHPCPSNSSQTCSDPIWFLNVQNRTPGVASPMYLQLVWSNQNTVMPGPFYRDGVGQKSYTAQVYQDLPVGRWTHLEAYLLQAPAGTYFGRLTVWQDGVLLFDMANVETKYSDGDDSWAVDLYSDSISPSPAVIYIDDAAISRQMLGP